MANENVPPQPEPPILLKPLRRSPLWRLFGWGAAASLALMLQMMGNDVRTAYDGEQAAVVASEFQPDVALLDIGMPTLDGYEAARRIRRESNGRPVRLVALTGYGQESDRRKSQEAGFDRHLVKPLRPQALLELLADLEKSASLPSSSAG